MDLYCISFFFPFLLGNNKGLLICILLLFRVFGVHSWQFTLSLLWFCRACQKLESWQKAQISRVIPPCLLVIWICERERGRERERERMKRPLFSDLPAKILWLVTLSTLSGLISAHHTLAFLSFFLKNNNKGKVNNIRFIRS